MLIGAGSVSELPAELARAGCSKVVLVTSATLAESSGLVREAEEALPGKHQATFTGISQHTPDRAVEQLQDLLRQTSADGVVSLGGGSVIDGCKAAIHEVGAAGLTHLAVPTTLSGAEFTASAGVTDSGSHQKRGLVDPEAAPKRVLLDPLVTLSTPSALWLSSGIRALDHAVETVWAPERDPLATFLAQEAIRRLRRSLPDCLQQPQDVEARQSAQLASWWAALGLASCSMGPSHQLGRLLGAPFGIPHGITSCVFLPPTIAYMAERDHTRLEPLVEPFGVSGVEEVAAACRRFIGELGLPDSLSEAGLRDRDLPRFLEMVPPEWHPIVEASR